MTNPNTSTSAVDPTQPPVDDKTETLPKVDEGAEQKPVEGAGDEGAKTPPETPTPRTYTEEEWNKRQSSIDVQMESIRKQGEDTLAKMQKQFEDTRAETEKRQDAEFIAKVETDGGDVDAARRLVAREQTVRTKEREHETKEQTFKAEMGRAFEVAKRNDADKFARQYGIDDVDALLKAENPVEMELIAVKLSLEKAKTQQKPPTKTDSGVSSGKGADWSKLSPTEKVLEGIKDMEI